MPLTPMMPGCPALTPNGPPYHYNEPIPPAPSSLSTSQSQPAFQQKLQQYQQHVEMGVHGTAVQKQQPQTHSHFTASQYQESYPHTQTYQQPIGPQPQHQQPIAQQHNQQLPASSSYLSSVSQSGVPHYTQPGLTTQNFQLNGTQPQVIFFSF